MSITNSLTLTLFALLWILPLIIYLQIRHYKTAALGLLYSNKNQTIRAFQIFAVAMIIYAISMIILVLAQLLEIYLLKNVYIFTSIILTMALIYVYYKLYSIMKVK